MTLSDLTDEVLAYLRSFTKDQEVGTHLTKPLSESDLTFEVADVNFASRGRAQIGDEVLWIDSIDRETKNLTIAPYGRGFDGTTAKAHEAGTQIITNPLYPRYMVHRVINQVIDGLGNDLYAVRSVFVKAKTLGYNYPLPEDARNVLSISYQMKPSSYKYPSFVRKWTFDPAASPDASPTGKCVYIYDVVTPLFEYAITYAGWPQPLSSPDAPFTDSGLPSSSYDVVVLGAASRLMSVATAALIQSQSVEAQALESGQVMSGALAQSKYLYGLYVQRLSEERMRLLNSTNQRSHVAP
jgi:hypothetical protein